MNDHNPTLGNAPGLPAAWGSPHDKLMAAISILQMKSLADDSNCSGPASWGTMFMPCAGLDHVIHLLIDILPDVELIPEAKQ